MISSVNRRTLDNHAVLCHYMYINDGGTLTKRVKLKDTTFVLGDKPMKTLLWCDKVPKGKRNKPAKINGIQHHEISSTVVPHTYYQPLN